MKHKMIAASMCLTFLLGATAWSAPKVTQPTSKAPSPDEIRVESVEEESSDYSTQTGMTGLASGGGEWWILRADDTASHFLTQNGYASMEGGADINDAVGMMEPGSFKRMLDYLQWTRMLDRKAPQQKPGGLQITLKRGGKAKNAILAYGSPMEEAAASTTLTLVKAFTRDVVWKTAAQLKTGTGLAMVYEIEDGLDTKQMEEAKMVPLPLFSVINAAGKEVAVLRPNTDKERAAFLSPTPLYRDTWGDFDRVASKDLTSYFTLAPGTYRLVFKKLTTVAPTNTTTTPFIWKALGDRGLDNAKGSTVVVKPGYFDVVTIRLEKKAAPQRP